MITHEPIPKLVRIMAVRGLGLFSTESLVVFRPDVVGFYFSFVLFVICDLLPLFC